MCDQNRVRGSFPVFYRLKCFFKNFFTAMLFEVTCTGFLWPSGRGRTCLHLPRRSLPAGRLPVAAWPPPSFCSPPPPPPSCSSPSFSSSAATAAAASRCLPDPWRKPPLHGTASTPRWAASYILRWCVDIEIFSVIKYESCIWYFWPLCSSAPFRPGFIHH